MQRVCESCNAYLQHPQSLWSKLPFRVQVVVASFLPVSSVLSLFLVDQRTHRSFTSRDFDRSYWKYLCNRDVPLMTLIDQSNCLKIDYHDEEGKSNIHLSIRTIRNKKEEEDTSVLSCTDGCRWRLEYAEKEAIPNSLNAALFFIRYSVVSLRITALRQLRQQSIQQSILIQEVAKKRDVIVNLIRCLQFGNNEISRQHIISREIIELMLMAAGCLLNMTQTSTEVSTIFRDSEGITTLISVLQNETINAKSYFRAV